MDRCGRPACSSTGGIVMLGWFTKRPFAGSSSSKVSGGEQRPMTRLERIMGGPRPSGPRQLPNDFKSLPLVRSYATTDNYGNIIHTQVRKCPVTGILVQARTPYGFGPA